MNVNEQQGTEAKTRTSETRMQMLMVVAALMVNSMMTVCPALKQFLQEANLTKPTYKYVLLMKMSAHRSGGKTDMPSIDHDHVLKQTNGCKLKDSWILLDNQLMVDIV
jgi:hypothetical protein